MAYKSSSNFYFFSFIRYLTLERVSQVQTLYITNASSEKEPRHYHYIAGWDHKKGWPSNKIQLIKNFVEDSVGKEGVIAPGTSKSEGLPHFFCLKTPGAAALINSLFRSKFR